MRNYLAAPALLLLLGGCGLHAKGDPTISGLEVAAMAQKAFDAQSGAIHGTMTCGSLMDQTGQSARCQRVTEKDGTVIKLGVTVSVIRPGRPYRVHVQADAQPEEFGLTGDVVEADLTKRYTDTFGHAPDAVSCPYLPGIVGSTIDCKLTADGDDRDISVTVDGVDPATYATHYTFAPL